MKTIEQVLSLLKSVEGKKTKWRGRISGADRSSVSGELRYQGGDFIITDDESYQYIVEAHTVELINIEEKNAITKVTPKMKAKYEYTIRTMGYHEVGRRDQRLGFLNEQGTEGWKLITVVYNMMLDHANGVATFDFYFKRELK